MKKQFGEYFLGLDIGTNSIGWAVTDLNYNIQKLNGKAMWGIRLFEAGKTAEERRTFRSARRRRQRQLQRIDLLQDLFRDEISKKDANFYLRLEESKFYPDDKTINQKNSLFSDKTYTDKDYMKEFPSIYHLRKALIENKKEYDIRLVYLAIHHILKNRGHFLFEGQELQSATKLEPILIKLQTYFKDEFNTDFEFKSLEEVEKILEDKALKKRDKKKELTELLIESDKQQITVIDLLLGYKRKLSNIFDDPSYAESTLDSISFSEATFQEKRDDYSDLLEDRMYLIDLLSAIYDWSLLAETLQGHEFLSFAKVEKYEKHKKDLSILKQAIKQYAMHEYYNIFSSPTIANNYCAYSGKKSKKTDALKDKCSQEDFNSFIGKVLDKIDDEDNDQLKYLKNEVENKSLMPKQVSKENSVIPYQVHLNELRTILRNVSKYHTFLNNKDDKGLTVSDKVISIMEFRIPYYIGPLNDYHADTKFAWIEKRSNEKIYPWNFKDVVDEEKSAEKFIRRMTNKCTYLYKADVLPKHSLLHSEFQVLNELNNLKINEELISVELKSFIFNDLYKKERKVTTKKLKTFLMANGYIGKSDSISGIDIEIKNSLTSYHDMKNIIGNVDINTDMIEEIIKWITLFGDSGPMLQKRIVDNYGDLLDKDQVSKILSLKYSGWGRLSKELLCDIYDVNKETGELLNIINAMRDTNNNLMELLSGRHEYSNKISKMNLADTEQDDKLSYQMVEDLRLSPAVKRGIWQALQIVEELMKIMQKQPKKIFVEFAREEGIKRRTTSRRQNLIDLYANCKEDCMSLMEGLESKSDVDLRDDRLYLYYTQMGRCMYTGETIDLSTLLNDKNSKIYDIDHIYPRSKIKDDSLENRVLVKKTANMKKGDNYPLPSEYSTQKPLWKNLHENNLIGNKKYKRLTERKYLSDDDLADFVERQLVETRQSTKAFAEILKKIMPDSPIVYVKANNVTEFRNKFEIVKVREINDLHHAKDAYLNIVVGNVYDSKFTRNPRNFVKESHGGYNLRTLFEKDVLVGNYFAWKGDRNGTIKDVKKTVEKNNILFTRHSFEHKGGISDQQIMPKGKGQLPIKSGDPRLLNIDRYGGFNKVSTAYFFLVEHDIKGKRIRSIEYVPVHLASTINGREDLIRYCINNLNLINPDIRLEKIKINALLSFDGFRAHLKSRTGERLVFSSAHQLYMPLDFNRYLKNIYNILSRRDLISKDGLVESLIDNNININIYDYLSEKLTNSIYKTKLSAQIKNFHDGRDLFLNLSKMNQIEALSKIIQLFRCVSGTTDLTLIGAKGTAGSIRNAKTLNIKNKVLIINQSITGIFEKEVDLNTV